MNVQGYGMPQGIDTRGVKRGLDESGDLGGKRQKTDNTPPSKVLFCRNLPHDVTEPEFLQLFYPFGAVVRHLLVKGKGQAFVQFADINTAINVVNYYRLSPVQLRGRTTFIDFSSRSEIETKDTSGGPSSSDVQHEPSCILVVTITNLVYPVTVEVLHQVFSKFGAPLKIICFVKNDQQKALVQMDSVATASSAKNSLDGQNIYTGCNTLHIVYSRLTELKVKFNNDKSRDFTNPTLPSDAPPTSAYGPPGSGLLPGGYHMADPFGAGPGMFPGGAMAIPQGMAMGGAPMGTPVVIVSGLPEDKMNPDNLFTLFGIYGDVIRVKIMYNKRDTALIQFNDVNQANLAIQHLNGVKLFGNPIKVNKSKHTSVAMPRAGTEQAGSGCTKEYMNSPLHRYRRADGKNMKNISAPSSVLHVSGLTEDPSIDDDLMINMFRAFGEVVNFKFFDNNKKMALVEMASIDDSVAALVALDNHELLGRHIRVQFSKSTIKEPPLAERGIDGGAVQHATSHIDSVDHSEEIPDAADPTGETVDDAAPAEEEA